ITKLSRATLELEAQQQGGSVPCRYPKRHVIQHKSVAPLGVCRVEVLPQFGPFPVLKRKISSNDSDGLVAVVREHCLERYTEEVGPQFAFQLGLRAFAFKRYHLEIGPAPQLLPVKG